MKKRPFLLLSGAFVFGEVCCYMSVTVAAVLLFLSAGAAAVVWAGVLPPGFLRLSGRRTGECRLGRSGRPVWPLMVPLLFLAGMLRMADACEWSGLAARAAEAEAQVQVKAVLQVDEIRRTDNSLQFYTRTIPEIREQNSDASDGSTQLYGAVVTLKGDEEAAENIKIGDVLTGEGTFSLFDAATNFGQFDLRQYYKALGLEGRIKLNSWQWDSGPCFGLSDAGANLVYRGKQFLLGRLYRAMGVDIGKGTGGGAGETSGESAEKDAGLLGAILAGEKSGISDEDQKLFQESGISHMYAVSGVHASILGRNVSLRNPGNKDFVGSFLP